MLSIVGTSFSLYSLTARVNRANPLTNIPRLTAQKIIFKGIVHLSFEWTFIERNVHTFS